jgi:hypothetical protein
MKHAPRNMTENMHGLLESMFTHYACALRTEYPGRAVRKATVFASAISEFERLGFIELVDARIGIPQDVPDFLGPTIKRAKPSSSPRRTTHRPPGRSLKPHYDLTSLAERHSRPARGRAKVFEKATFR